MTTIYLIRHAEAEGNLYRIAHGHYDGLITDRGYRQIEALRRRFADIPIDAVYSSDLFRTRTTAAAIYAPKHLPLHTDPDLREVHLGVWEGHTWEEMGREYPQQMYYFNKQVDLWQVPESETAAQARDREMGALRRIVRENPNKTVAVFTHGAILRIVLGTMQGIPLEGVGKTGHGDNTAVSLVEAEGDNFRVIFRDDNSHLEKEGLSTFAKQKWWKDAKAVEAGERYAELSRDDPFYLDCCRAAWEENGGAATDFSAENALNAARGGRLIGVWERERPVGILLLIPDRDAEEKAGWIDFYYLIPSYRGRHYGIPPLGQAVQYYRERGCDRLRMRCTEKEQKTMAYFQQYGFHALRCEGTDTVLEKYIGYGERV